MKAKLYICISLSLILILTGCSRLIYGKITPYYKDEWRSGKFREGTNTHISEKLNCNGFFAPCNDDRAGFLDVYYTFYNDGSYLSILFQYGNNRYLRHKPGVDLCANIWHTKGEPYLYSGGYYALRGDTIVIDIYFCYGMENTVNLRKQYFKIEDRNHIRQIGEQAFMLTKGPSKIQKLNVLYEFVPASNLPPEGYVSAKLEKEMWYDEGEWRSWMQKMGRKAK